MTGEGGRPRAFGDRFGLLLLAGACGYLLFELWPPPPPIDDAFISLRHADNLVRGHGLVWNAGERVEGITNLLWTLLLAGLLALGVPGSPALYGLSTASAVLALAATYALMRACLPPSHRAHAGLSALLLLTSSAFAVWARSGLETPLLACFAALALLAVVRDRPWAATAALMVAGLLRPDAWLLAPPTLWFGFAGRRGGLPGLLPYAGALALSVTLVTGFRLAYYGSPLPNTFYAKVGGLPWFTGFTYVGLCLLAGPLLWLPFVLLGARDTSAGDPGHTTGSPRTGPLARVVVAQSVLHTGYLLFVGGDVFPFGRFFVVLLPGLIVLAILGGLRAPPRISVAALVVHLAAVWAGAPVATFAYGVLSLLVWAALTASGRVRLGRPLWSLLCRARSSGASGAPGRSPVGQGWLASLAGIALVLAVVEPRVLPGKRFTTRLTGTTAPAPGRRGRIEVLDRFNRFAITGTDRMVDRILARPPDPPTIAALAIGRLGYRLPYPIIDVVGLTDPAVARAEAGAPPIRSSGGQGEPLLPGHHRSNAGYVLSRRPGLILIPRNPPIPLPAVDDLLAHPRFRAEYVFDPVLPGYRHRHGL